MPAPDDKVGCPECGHTFKISGNRAGSMPITGRCLHCGDEFESPFANKKYCSRAHQVAAYRTKRLHEYRT
jgi:DNA-directed RNA polymerase subunit RPC12/RpoP